MRKLSLTALATIMAASVASQAQATCSGADAASRDCVISPLEIHLQDELYLTGTGGLKLHNVKVIVPSTTVEVKAPESIDNAIELMQSNTGDITSSTSVTVNGADLMEASSTAMANVANIDVYGGISLEGAQTNSGNVSSSLGIASYHGGDLNATSTAIANAVNATASGDAIFDMRQTNSGESVTASLQAGVYGRGVGEVNTAATAIANTFSLELDGVAIGSIVQENCADVTASNVSDINVWKDPATATAIGNAINITRVAGQ